MIDVHKLFCISDVHGFYNEMVEALNIAGFDPKNKNHWLVSCGDHFDRGSQPLEVMRYLMSLPRAVLIRGNHESLFEECCERGYPKAHDFSNGTYSTICKLGGEDYGRSFSECCIIAQAKTWPFLKKMVNYFETENYVFVHSSIPFGDDWRHAHQYEWNDAMWVNPFEEFDETKYFLNKQLIFGHWHASWPRAKWEGKPEFGEGADFSIYYGNGYIGIDGCTALTHKVNVLVIEDEFMEKNE